MTQKLKLAIQKSGRLQEGSMLLLKECGIKIEQGRGQLVGTSASFPLEVLFLRNTDIPEYVEDGVADIAIIGHNTLVEKEKNLEELLPLGFSKCRLTLAVPRNENYTNVNWLQGKRIATSYPNSLQKFLAQKNITAEIHNISGSVEIAPNIGLADAICDLVETGSTLLMNGLKEVEPILHSEAILVANRKLEKTKKDLVDKLLFRIKAVQRASNTKYVLMNIPTKNIDKVCHLLPGMKSPTILSLKQEGWSSIHTVVEEKEFWQIIEQLKTYEAEGILVIPIEKMIQ